MISLDVIQNQGKYLVQDVSGFNTGLEVQDVALMMQEHGAGELLVNSIDRDGLIAMITSCIRECMRVLIYLS